jgi:hypothetical protein
LNEQSIFWPIKLADCRYRLFIYLQIIQKSSSKSLINETNCTNP